MGTTVLYWVSAEICGIVEHDAYILTLLYVIRDLAAKEAIINPWPLYRALLWAGILGINLTIAGGLRFLWPLIWEKRKTRERHP